MKTVADRAYFLSLSLLKIVVVSRHATSLHEPVAVFELSQSESLTVSVLLRFKSILVIEVDVSEEEADGLFNLPVGGPVSHEQEADLRTEQF